MGYNYVVINMDTLKRSCRGKMDFFSDNEEKTGVTDPTQKWFQTTGFTLEMCGRFCPSSLSSSFELLKK